MNRNMCGEIVNWCVPQKAEVVFRREYNRAIESSRQHNNYLKKKKRFRSLFTTDQVLVLENEFKRSPYVNNVHRRELAAKINISEKAIKVWFQNRRMKEKLKNVFNEEDTEDQRNTSVETVGGKSNLSNSSSFNEGHILSLPVITYDTIPNSHQELINKQIICNNYNDQSLNNEEKATDLITRKSVDVRLRSPTSPVQTLDLRIKRKQENSTKSDETCMKQLKQDDKVYRAIVHPSPKEIPPTSQDQSSSVTTEYVPVYYNRYIPHPYVHGSTSWQPMNIMPLLTTGAHPSMVNVGAQSSNACYCNCHKKETEETPPAQHIVIMPPYDIQYQHFRH